MSTITLGLCPIVFLFIYLSIYLFIYLSRHIAVCICMIQWKDLSSDSDRPKTMYKAMQQSSKIQLHSKSRCKPYKHFTIFTCFSYTFQPLTSIYSSSLVNHHLVTSPIRDQWKIQLLQFSYFVDLASPGLLFEEGESWRLRKQPWAPKTMKNKGFGHLKTRLFTIKTSKNVGLGGPWNICSRLEPRKEKWGWFNPGCSILERGVLWTKKAWK